MKHIFAVAMLIIVGLPATVAAATNVEQVFREAGNYTVYIETSIAVPFIEDTAGSFLGTGFVVDHSRRWIMTNAHVSGHSPATISVEFKNGVSVAARPIYIDALLDLAILEYAATDADIPQAQAKLECKTVPGVGHPVGAFGHPWGLKFSGTRGIISGRTSRVGGDLLQTDSPINSGNSGGPLISLETGRVVGINSSSIDGEEAQNTNFAVIGTQACRVLSLLAQGEQPQPPHLGVTFYDIEEEPTLMLAQVSRSAQQAGFVSGDVILAVDGEPIEPANEGELLHLLRGKVGTAEFSISRNDETVRITPKLPPQLNALDRTGILIAGILFAPSNIRDLERLATPAALSVHYVQPGSQAEAAGIAKYDQVLTINGETITDLQALRAALAKSNDELVLSLLRFAGPWDRYIHDVRAVVPNAAAEVIGFE